MKALLVLTFVALFAFSRAAQLRSAHHTAHTTAAPKVHAEPLKQVLALLSSKEKGSYENAVKANDILNNIIATLLADQDAADAQFRQDSKQCDDDVADLNSKITSATNEISGLNNRISSLNADIAKYHDDLNHAQDKLNRTQIDCDSTISHMEEDLAGMSEDLKTTVTIMRIFDEEYGQRQNNNQTALLQTKTKAALMQAASKMVTRKAVAIVTALMMLKPSESVGTLVGSARNLIQMLHDQLALSQQQASSQLDNKRGTCQDLIHSIGDSIADITGQIGQANKDIASAQSRLGEVTLYLDQLNKQLESTHAHCTAGHDAYDARSADRAQEVQLVQRIQTEVRKLISDRTYIQDCEVSDWADWTACSNTCGGGEMSRTRTVVKQPTAGLGLSCPPLEQVGECNMQACPIDCQQSEWSDWSPCSADCGQGWRSRVRSTVTDPANGGRACGPSEEREQCFIKSCDADCVLGDWNDWSACSVDCGQGTQSRTQKVVTQAQGNGQCSPGFETRVCQGPSCPLPEGSVDFLTVNGNYFIKVPFTGPKNDNEIGNICRNAGLKNPCISQNCQFNSADCKNVGWLDSECTYPYWALSKVLCNGQYPSACTDKSLFRHVYVYMGNNWSGQACGTLDNAWCTYSQSIPQGTQAWALCVRP